VGLSLQSLQEVARRLFSDRYDVDPSNPPGAGIDLTHVPHDLQELTERLVEALTEQVDHARRWCTDPSDAGFAAALRCEDHRHELMAAQNAGIADLLAAATALPVVPANAGRQASFGGRQGKEAFQQVCGVARDLREQVIARCANLLSGSVLATAWRFCEWATEEQLTRGYLDFADLLGRLRNALRDDRRLRARWQAAFDYLLVDEFQDTDPLQAEIVLFLAEDEARSSEWHSVVLRPGKLFVVADPKQSIYRFRRADIGMYDDVKSLILRSGGSVQPIQRNFRTVQPIVEWINESFEVVIGQDAGPRRQPRYEPLVAHRSVAADSLGSPSAAGAGAVYRPGVVVVAGPPPLSDRADDVRRAEAASLAAALVEGVGAGRWQVAGGVTADEQPTGESWRPARWSDVAVLLRAATGIEVYEQALREAGVPFSSDVGKTFYLRREVRDAVLGLRAVADASDPLAIYGALHSTLFGFTDEELYLFSAAGGCFDYYAEQPPAVSQSIVEALAVLRSINEHLHEQPVDVTLAELLHRTLAYEAAAAWGDKSGQAVRNLDKLLQKARAFAATEGASLYSFVRWAEEQTVAPDETESPPDDDAEAIRLMTIHGAKGLEFPIVVLAGGCFSAARRRDGVEVLLDRGQGWFAIDLKLVGPGAGKQSQIVVRTHDYDRLRRLEDEMEASERRRLLYVAATRAKDLLAVLCAGWPKRSQGALLEPLRDVLHDALLASPEPLAAARSADAGGRGQSSAGVVTMPVSWGARVQEAVAPAVELSAALAARERWRAWHADVQSAARRAPAVAAPSRLEDVELRELRDQAAQFPSTGEREQALALGSAVHRAMELVPLGDAAARSVPAAIVARIAELAAVAVAELGPPPFSEALIARAQQLACACWLSDPVRQAAAAPRVYRELPLCIPLEQAPGGRGRTGHPLPSSAEAPLLQGYCDLLYKDRQGWVVADYKTDQAADAAAIQSRYQLQAAAYALAVEQVTGERPHRAVLVLAGAARAGEAAPTVEIPITGELLDEARQLATQIAGTQQALGA
jgi:ATP-dependent helicase/nuclease subunit A